jgi:membrane protein YdbS with pleckstrin-like domain
MAGLAALIGAQWAGGSLGGGPLFTLAALLVLAVGVGVIPELRWRRWRYEVRDEELDIRRGAFKVTRTLVPMLRVQHVETTRGLLEQLFGLSTVVVHTAAGETTIPALSEGDADRLRDRIAVLGRRPDDV